MSVEEEYVEEMHRIGSELENLNTIAFPQISAQLAEIWGEQQRRRKSDSKLLKSLVHTLLLVGNQGKRFGDVHESRTDMDGHVRVAAGIPGVLPDTGRKTLDFTGIAHISFFLSGLACGLAITSLIRGR